MYSQLSLTSVAAAGIPEETELPAPRKNANLLSAALVVTFSLRANSSIDIFRRGLAKFSRLKEVPSYHLTEYHKNSRTTLTVPYHHNFRLCKNTCWYNPEVLNKLETYPSRIPYGQKTRMD